MTIYKPTFIEVLNGVGSDAVAWLNVISVTVFIYLAIISIPDNNTALIGLYIIGVVLMVLSFYVRYELSKARIIINHKMKKIDALLKEINLITKKTAKRGMEFDDYQ